nr:L,D-transpeptidase [Bacteroides sp.]
MKTLTAIAALTLGFVAFAETEQPALLSEVTTAMISEYKGTREALLPSTDKRADIRREFSTVPGRMHMVRSITVNKEACRLYLKNALGDTLMQVGVCSSRNKGQKTEADDCKTPEGTFPLYGVYNSTDWTYKDTDSKCYGPIFLSLKTPRYWGVGIHGTNAPGSVPGRSSHGCIRMHNENILRIKPMVQKDLRVTVLPDHV